MKKEKYLVLVKDFFDKNERKSYPKNSIVELTKDKGDYLKTRGFIKKIKSKEKTKKKEKNSKEIIL